MTVITQLIGGGPAGGGPTRAGKDRAGGSLTGALCTRFTLVFFYGKMGKKLKNPKKRTKEDIK